MKGFSKGKGGFGGILWVFEGFSKEDKWVQKVLKDFKGKEGFQRKTNKLKSVKDF